MRKNVFILAAAALLFAGCAKEVAEKFETASYNTTISAVIDGADTKAALADDGTFTWQEGDKIAVYTSAKVFKEFVINTVFVRTLRKDDVHLLHRSGDSELGVLTDDNSRPHIAVRIRHLD